MCVCAGWCLEWESALGKGLGERVGGRGRVVAKDVDWMWFGGRWIKMEPVGGDR